MILQVDPEEAALLAKVLKDYLSDLRMEIVDTDSYAMRERLKLDEEIVRRVIGRLAQLDAGAV